VRGSCQPVAIPREISPVTMCDVSTGRAPGLRRRRGGRGARPDVL